jgi:uncharacterized membrane protein
MKTRLINVWESLRTSFWFIPSLMVLLSIGLSVLTVSLDHLEHYTFVKGLSWAWTGGALGAREMLSTIAGSMMTVTGVTFSITIVTLALAANQFGPRVLRSFMRDRGNQVVLGTFISTFTFCLLVLGRVRDLDETEFIPYLSVTVAVALALISLGVLIYFIHHVSYSIQAENLIATIADELHEVMDRLFPEKVGIAQEEEVGERDAERIRQELRGKSSVVRSKESGYLQTIGTEGLLHIAKEKNLFIQLYRRPGDFISADSVILETWPLGVYPGELDQDLNDHFVIARRRTPVQDVEYPIHQLVEVALRALSPSLNDPYSAVNCIDRLGAALVQLAQRDMPSPYRYDDRKQLRLVMEASSFTCMADIAFNQIREYGSTSVQVILRMLDHIAVIAERTRRREDRTALKRHAGLIRDQALMELKNEYDKEKVEGMFRKALQAINQRETVYSSNIEKFPQP